MKEVHRPLCHLLLSVSAISVTVVLVSTVVFDKIEEVIEFCPVEDCSDVNEVGSELVCALLERMAPKFHITYPMEHRMKSMLT